MEYAEQCLGLAEAMKDKRASRAVTRLKASALRQVLSLTQCHPSCSAQRHERELCYILADWNGKEEETEGLTLLGSSMIASSWSLAICTCLVSDRIFALRDIADKKRTIFTLSLPQEIRTFETFSMSCRWMAKETSNQRLLVPLVRPLQASRQPSLWD